MSEQGGSLTGLSTNEAKEFHSAYMQGFLGFTAVAVVAHILVWMWRPWIPGPDGYSALDAVYAAATSPIASLLT